jgi:hypothetical protein
MTDDEFAPLIERGHELRGIEFKAPGARTDPKLMAWVVKAVLGMANRRDGGYVIVGVDESTGTPIPVGLDPESLATWTHDDVASSIAASSDPPLTVEQETCTYQGRSFIVLRVSEFADLPVLAKKDISVNHQQVVRRGACYVRSIGKPETSEIPTQTEMRELLGLAIEKGVRKFVAQSANSGLLDLIRKEPSPTSAEQYLNELGDFPSHTLAKKIRSRCFWQLVVRPRDFVAARVSTRHVLTRVVRGAAVTYQGVGFPLVAPDHQIDEDGGSVGQSFDLGHHPEMWRAYLSGQCFHLSGNDTDWGSQRMNAPMERLEPGDLFIGVGYALYQFSVAFEFAARLAHSALGADEMTVELLVGNLSKHRLIADDPGRSPLRAFTTAGLDEFSLVRDLSKIELSSKPRELALEAAKKFIEVFDLELPKEYLKSWQEQWLRR